MQIVSACAQSKSLPYQIISLQNYIGQFLKSFLDLPNPVLLGYIMELGLGTSQKIFFSVYPHIMVPPAPVTKLECCVWTACRSQYRTRASALSVNGDSLSQEIKSLTLGLMLRRRQDGALFFTCTRLARPH